MDPTQIFFSVIASLLSSFSLLYTIYVFNHNRNMERESNDRTRKQLTIEQYHRIAYGDGPLRTFYQMNDEEFAKLLSLASGDRDYYRTEKYPPFLKLEDMLSALDEYASGIEAGLYDYDTFKTLAFNYGKKRVFGKIEQILNCYNNSKGNHDLSYHSLVALIRKLTPKTTNNPKTNEKNV